MAEPLTIGSRAPAIDIEHWMGDRQPVESFERGKVYVIEFWATWCGPCISSIPHLRDLQRRHAGDVFVVSVSDEKRPVIEEFLARSSGDETFATITGEYWLATDPDGSVKKDYMQAADQHGIPTAFIVGKTGEIEWIGHPMRIDDPVARVVDGTWDRAAFAEQLRERQEAERGMRLATQKLRQGQFSEALESLDAVLARIRSSELRGSLETFRQRIMAESRAGMVGGQAGAVDVRRLAIGDQVTMQVTGVADGPLWGDFLYTTDSSVGAAAVHAGLVRVGQVKTVKVFIVPPPGSFAEARRNGVQSRAWGTFPAAFIMQDAEAAATVAGGNRRVIRGPGLVGKAPGDIVEMTVKGRRTGVVWGTDVYTADSDVATAAVHAGVVKEGEETVILVAVVASPDDHPGAARNGVTSQSWGTFPQSIVIQRKTGPLRQRAAASAPGRSPRPLQALAVGESTTVTITGTDKGFVWGTDRYTGDSQFDAAAVHAGVLKVGEQGEVVVTRVPALARYEGSVRNGVQSRSWGAYQTAYTLARKPTGTDE